MTESKMIDPSVKWLAKSWLGETYVYLDRQSLLSQTKQRISDYICQELQRQQWNGPPFQPENLFKCRRILEKSEKALPSSHLGILIPVRGGFLMKIRAEVPKLRKRFTIAHEVGHTFFYDIDQEIPTRKFVRSRYWVEEDFANFVAGAILLPEASLREVIQERRLDPSLEALARLSKVYMASADVICHRLVRELRLWDCLIFKSVIESDGSIKTNGSFIFKGASFRGWIVPKLVAEHASFPSLKSPHESLRRGGHLQSSLVSAIKNTISYLRTGVNMHIREFDHRGQKFSLQAKINPKSSPSSCTFLVRKATV
ncbi:MAG: ImmA/IrrE family metallo-endopeptidase [Ignavibacteria bacterium]|nr:ImmA/IrrE family metallo-endopeptidase [Ignavibacteria bacterium]MBI3765970.1 ImmA/IrrE family metallo-endopeptidase [Ignavibacteriales bacterium]